MPPELLLDARADLGEGPAWDARSNCLYWVDIHAGHLHAFDPVGKTDRCLDLGEFIGCAVPRQAGGLVLALRSGFATLDSDSPPLAEHPRRGQQGEGLVVRGIVNPEAHLPGNRFNDGKCDPAGRLLAGTMDDAEEAASGSLYSLSIDRSLQTLLTGVRISNGLTWSPDARTFYYIDTPARQVTAFDYDLASGAIANPRPAITVPPEMGWPDGMTSDTEGMLWVAIWGGARLTRWDPATAQLLESIPFPALNVSSCAFGGPHLDELYVTSARKGMGAAQLDQYPLSGSLFRLRPGVQGMPTFAFGG